MKLNILKSGLTIALMSIFTGCTVSDKPFATGTSEIQTYELTTTKTVASLKAMATGTAVQYTSDDVIEAYVTSNDAAGNFYKSISFQNVPTASGTPIGFSVSVNKAMTFADGFYPGRKVYIKLKGLYFGIVYGSLKIGANSALDGIESFDYQKYLFPSATVLNESDLLRHLTLANARLDANQNTLIEVDNVQFADSSIGRTYFDVDSGGYATNQTIEDPNTGAISICRISQYAPFSVGKIPSGKGSIRGVMTKYNTDYQYMVRYESDFKLTGARTTTLFNEGFNTNAGAWTSFSVVGAEVWAYSATFGNPGGMMKMSGYATTNKANEDWLISPLQNFSTLTTASLSFDNAYKFIGNPIEVKISNNYSGTGSPLAAGVTWTTLTGAALSAGNYVYANSGALSLASFVGAGNSNIHIAFRYTSTTTAASTWEIDNIKVIGN